MPMIQWFSSLHNNKGKKILNYIPKMLRQELNEIEEKNEMKWWLPKKRVDLFEEVYMQLPQGIELMGEDISAIPTRACKLHKSLYGLKQVARQWNQKLTQALVLAGFTQAKSDYSFVKNRNGVIVLVLMYVDDMDIASNRLEAIVALKESLQQQFKLKDLGELKYFFGLEVARSTEGIIVSQQKFALEMLEEAGFLTSKPASIPLTPNHKLMHSGE